MQYFCTYDSKIGRIYLVSDGDYLINVLFTPPHGLSESTQLEVFTKTKKWLDQYFLGKPIDFDIPHHLHGSEFCLQVWQKLMTIPYGEVRTYSQIALMVNNKSAQAVGGAIKKNPLAIIIPCHRVIGKDGTLTGFSGGLDIKQSLLNHEFLL